MAPVTWIANFQSWCSWIIQEPQASLTLPLVSIGSFSTKKGNHSVLFTSTYPTRELKFLNRSIKTCKVILITLGVPLCYSVVYHIHLEMSIWDDKWRFIRVHDMKGAARYDLSLDSARNRKKENVRKWKLLATIFALAFGKRHTYDMMTHIFHVWYCIFVLLCNWLTLVV